MADRCNKFRTAFLVRTTLHAGDWFPLPSQALLPSSARRLDKGCMFSQTCHDRGSIAQLTGSCCLNIRRDGGEYMDDNGQSSEGE
jgi:hypothetical protein